MNAPLLCCRGLEAGYGTSRVLFGLDFDIRAGEVVALLGRNGMGKSTTIRTIVGGLRPQRGEIVFDGRPIHAERADAIARLGVAIVPEGRQCFPNLTVNEHLVAFAARRKGVADEVAREALDEVDPAAEEAAARALVRKKLRSLSGVDDVTAIRRLVGMLARKGYGSGLAFAVVKDELAGAGRDEPAGLDLPDD